MNNGNSNSSKDQTEPTLLPKIFYSTRFAILVMILFGLPIIYIAISYEVQSNRENVRIEKFLQSKTPDEIVSFSINSNEVLDTQTIGGFLESISDWEIFHWGRNHYDEKHTISITPHEGETVSFDLLVRHEHKDVILWVAQRHELFTSYYGDIFSSKLVYKWVKISFLPQISTISLAAHTSARWLARFPPF